MVTSKQQGASGQEALIRLRDAVNAAIAFDDAERAALADDAPGRPGEGGKGHGDD